MRIINAILIGFAVLAAVFFLYAVSMPRGTPTEYGGAVSSSAASASAYARMTGADGAIEIDVQPLGLGSSTWTFSFGLDTHMGSLDMDMEKVVTLTDDRGDIFTPTAWNGPGPGGHHRNGTLKFPAPSSTPKSFTITVTIPGGTPQLFSWETQ